MSGWFWPEASDSIWQDRILYTAEKQLCLIKEKRAQPFKAVLAHRALHGTSPSVDKTQSVSIYLKIKFFLFNADKHAKPSQGNRWSIVRLLASTYDFSDSAWRA